MTRPIPGTLGLAELEALIGRTYHDRANEHRPADPAALAALAAEICRLHTGGLTAADIAGALRISLGEVLRLLADSEMTARNPKAFNEGQAVRAAVRAIMAAHSPLARPLTAKAINARLQPALRRSERTIQAHMLAIQDETELQLGIDSVQRNSSPESSAA